MVLLTTFFKTMNCFLTGINIIQIKGGLDKCYASFTQGKSINWDVEFRRGRTNTDEAHRPT